MKVTKLAWSGLYLSFLAALSSDLLALRYQPSLEGLEQQIQKLSSQQANSANLARKEINSLQREVRDLRGLIETQEHQLQVSKSQTTHLFLDLDRRLNKIIEALQVESNQDEMESLDPNISQDLPLP